MNQNQSIQLFDLHSTHPWLLLFSISSIPSCVNQYFFLNQLMRSQWIFYLVNTALTDFHKYISMLENIALRRFQHNYHDNIAKEGSPVSGLYPTLIESFFGPHKPFQRVNLL